MIFFIRRPRYTT